MAEGGWIKLHRKIRDNWIWEDPEKLRAWLDILLMANREDKAVPFNGKIITIKKGQKLTSIYKLAERWGWSRHRVQRFLSLLKEDNMCTADGSTGGTIITVVNWDFYQMVRTTVGPTNDTTVEPTDGPTVGPQTRIYKNNKEGEKGCRPPQSDEPDPHATDDEGIRRYLEAEEAKGRWN